MRTYSLQFNFNIRFRNADDERVHTRTVDVKTFESYKLSSIYGLVEAHAKTLADNYQLTVYGKCYSAVDMVIEEPIVRLEAHNENK